MVYFHKEIDPPIQWLHTSLCSIITVTFQQYSLFGSIKSFLGTMGLQQAKMHTLSYTLHKNTIEGSELS